MTVDLAVIEERAKNLLRRWDDDWFAKDRARDVLALAEEVRYLATSLLEIAELAMPDTYFQTDSRVNRALAALPREPAEEAK